MAQPKRKNYEFDQSKLAELTEPFMLHVEKVVGDRRTPLPGMPPGRPGQPHGHGWTTALVLERLGECLITLAGGGEYAVTAIDEHGKQYTWKWGYDPIHIPDKIPTVMAAAAAAVPAAITAPLAPPNGAPVAVAPVQHFNPTATIPVTPASPVPVAAVPTVANEVAALPYHERLWTEKERAIKLQGELERLEMVKRLERLEEENRKLLTEAQSRAADAARLQAAASVASPADAKLAALEAELAREREARRSAEERRERERAEEKFDRTLTAINAQIAAMQQATQQQIAAMQASFQSALAAQPKGPDPTIQLMLSMQQQSMEATKEIARQHADALKVQAGNQPNFRDMLDATDKMNAQSGVATVVKTVTENATAMLGMQRQFMEFMQSQMGGSQNPLIDLGGQLMGSIKDVAERYIHMKESETANKSRAAAATAQAQAAAVAATAQAQMAQRGLAGPAPVASPQPQPQSQPQPSSPQATKPANGSSAGGTSVAAYELDLFGPALEAVRRLRAAAATWLRTGGKSGSSPAAAASHVIAGVEHFRSAGKLESVKAFAMLPEKMYGHLAKVLVPDAPGDYQRALAGELERLVGGGQPVADAPGDEDEEDGDEGEGEGEGEGEDDGDMEGEDAPAA